MKKIARAVALVLVLVMAAGSFTGCVTRALFENGYDAGYMEAIAGPVIKGVLSSGHPLAILLVPFVVVGLAVVPVVGAVALDIVTSPIQIAIYAVNQSRGKKYDNIDTFFPDGGSVSSSDMDSLARKLNSIPEAEIGAYTEAVNSFSEAESSALLEAVKYLSEEQIASSIALLNSMTEEDLIAVMNSFGTVKFRIHDNGGKR